MVKTLYVFLSSVQSVNYLFPNGKAAVFQNGRYLTDLESEAAQLDSEIAQKHPHISRPVLEVDRTIQSDQLDPMSQLRSKIRAEILAEERAAVLEATNPLNDMGSTTQTQVVPASTTAFSEMTQIPGAAPMASESLARLINLPGIGASGN